jgi:hypothetical protein
MIYLDQLGLRIPIAQFHLIDSRLYFQWVGRQILNASDVEARQHEMSISELHGIGHRKMNIQNAYLLIPIFRTLPFSTISSSFFQVG